MYTHKFMLCTSVRLYNVHIRTIAIPYQSIYRATVLRVMWRYGGNDSMTMEMICFRRGAQKNICINAKHT